MKDGCRLPMPLASKPRLSIVIGMALLTFMGGVAIAHHALTNDSEQSRLANNPYRYPYSPQLPGNGKPALVIQREIAFYQKRMQIDPQSGLNLASLAQAYLKMGKATGQGSWYLLAEQSAQRSLTNLPFHNTGAILALAKVQEARHQFKEALALTQEAFQEKPGDPDILAIAVTCHLAMGQYQQAEMEAEKIVHQVRTLGSLALLALAKANMGQDTAAIQLFQEAIRLEEPGELGGSAWVRTLLGRFYAQRGDHQHAETLYQEALRIIPRYPLALIQLGDLELRRQNPQAAQKLYQRVMSDSRNGATIYDHWVLRGLARSDRLQGNHTEAEALYARAEKTLRDEGVGHTGGSFGHRRELAQLLLERGNPQDLKEALSLMREEVKIRRDSETLDVLAWALMRSGQPQAARQVLQEVIDRGSKDAVVFYRAGILDQQLGRFQSAKAFFQRSRLTDPTLDAEAKQWVGL